MDLVIYWVIIIIGIIVGIYNQKKSKKNKLNIFFGVNIIYVWIYGIVPILMRKNGFYIKKTDFYLIKTIDLKNELYIYASFIILIGYLFFLIGYFISRPYKKNKIQFKVSDEKLKKIGIYFLIISTLSVLLTAKILGGFLTSFTKIMQLRAGEISVPGYIFLLLPLSVTSFIIFFSLKISKKKNKAFLLLILSLFNSLYYVFIFGGRLPIVLFLMLIPLYYLDKKNKFNIKYILVIILIGFLLLSNLRDFLRILEQNNHIKDSRGLLEKMPRLVSQFSFPYINVLKVHSFTFERGEFRYFIDYFTWIYNYIPKFLLNKMGLSPITPSYLLNSNNHLGAGIPTDIISFGYYQFSIPGVIIVSTLFGKMIALFDSAFKKLKHIPFILMIKIRFFEIVIFFPMYGDVEAIMRRRVDLVALVIIFLIYSKKIKTKRGIK